MKNLETLGQRLAHLMNNQKPKRATQKEIAAVCGVKYQSVQRWLKDETNPDTDNIRKLSEHFGVSADYLLFGESEQATTGQAADPRRHGSEFTAAGTLWAYDDIGDLEDGEEDDELYFVDFTPNLLMDCGNGYVNDEEQLKIKFPFYLRSLHKAGVQDPSKVVVGYANGESNAPTIPHKAAIGIDKGCTRIYHEEVYLITIEGEERLKQIINMGEGRFMLRSLNPDKEFYPDEILTAEDMFNKQFVVHGRMFWVSWLKPLRK